MPGKSHYQNKDDLIKEVKVELEKGKGNTGGKLPRVLVMGALGRCGTGALDLCREVGIPDTTENLVKWDLPETKDRPGPYAEIREADVSILALLVCNTRKLTDSKDIRQLHISKRQDPPIRIGRLPKRRQEKSKCSLRRQL